MKKILILSLLLFAAGLTRAQGFAPTYTPQSACAGDTVCFAMMDTSIHPMPPQYYTLWNFPGSPQAVTTVNAMQICHVFTNPGWNIVRAVVYSSPSFDTIDIPVWVGPICPGLDLIEGVVYNDTNANGNQDSLERGRPYHMVQLNPGGPYVTTDATGHYSFLVPAGNYTVSLVPPLYHTVTEPVSGSYSITTTGAGLSYSGNDFGISAIPGVRDLAVYISGGPPVPGRNRWMTVAYMNRGTTTMTGSVSFIHDALMTYLSASPVAPSYNGATRTVSWPFTGLMPGEVRYETITLNCPQNASLGAPVQFLASIDPIAGDTAPVNNLDTLDRVVVASYDPNDKTVDPDGDILAGTRLGYRIRFQNTGTAPAEDVVLRDTLDSDLDFTTLTILGSSHPMTWQLDQHNVLTFYFMGINLPDSVSNEPASHGSVSYAIRAKSGLSPGTQIHNNTSIYFDFNAPIVTNTTTNTIVTPVGMWDPKTFMQATVWPNPAGAEAFIRVDGEAEWQWQVTDMQGRILRSGDNSGASQVRADLNGLPAGLYTWMIRAKNNRQAAGKLLITGKN